MILLLALALLATVAVAGTTIAFLTDGYRQIPTDSRRLPLDAIPASDSPRAARLVASGTPAHSTRHARA